MVALSSLIEAEEEVKERRNVAVWKEKLAGDLAVSGKNA